MTDDDDKKGRIRTRPLDESPKLKEALLAELAKLRSSVLLIVAGPDVGARKPLVKSIVVGRDPEASLALRDESVSWRHVRIEDRGGGEWAAVDLGSTNGTTHVPKNGEPHRIEGTITLAPGDRLSLGQTILEYDEEDALRAGYNEEIQRQLSVDELSGLWAKRRFDTQLLTTVAAAIRTGSPLSLLVMDLDGVKAINDTNGHEAGAFVIGTAGHVIGEVVGKRGFATRFGGDEFVAALPDTKKEDAVRFAEELRKRVADYDYAWNDKHLSVGLSCGVATAPEDAQSSEELFNKADHAMYRAKRGGKNKVCT